MQIFPNVAPWFKSNVLILAMVVCLAIASYGWIARDVDEHWWLYMLAGGAGLLNFGILTMISGRKSRRSRAVGTVSIAVGSLVVLGLACMAVFIVITIALLLYTFSQMH